MWLTHVQPEWCQIVLALVAQVESAVICRNARYEKVRYSVLNHLTVEQQPKICVSDNVLHELAPWTRMQYDVNVEGMESDVEFVCELRATSGEVWFDVDSLRVSRKK